MKAITSLWDSLSRLFTGLSENFVVLVARLALACVFWLWVQARISGWEVLGQSLMFFNLDAATIRLFEGYNLPLLPASVAAHMATWAEFFFAIMLAIGLGTRLAAFGLLVITAIIQFVVVPAAWSIHLLWLALLLYILKLGGGAIALDAIFKR